MDRLSIETYNNTRSGNGNAAANANNGAGNSASIKNFYLYDGRGSVSELTGMTGTVTAKYRYDDFGKLKEIQKFNTAEETGKDNSSVLDALGNLFGITNSKDQEQNQTQTPGYHEFYAYNAESYNPNTEMQYLRARYYKPETANFLTEDSYLGDILKPLTLNRYNYCAGNPVNYKDPSGNSFGDFDEIENYKYVGFELLKSAVSDKVAKIIDIVETPDKIYRDIRDGINCALEEEIQKISESVEKAGAFVKSALIGGVLTSSVPGSTMPQYAKDYDSRLETAGELYREYDAKSSAISEKYEAMQEETVNSYLDSSSFPWAVQGGRLATKAAITITEIHYAAEMLATGLGPLLSKIGNLLKAKKVYTFALADSPFVYTIEEGASEIATGIANVIKTAIRNSSLAALLTADATERAKELLGGDENQNSLKNDANSAQNAGNADKCPNASKTSKGKSSGSSGYSGGIGTGTVGNNQSTGNYVYRTIRPDENINFGLKAKNPNANYTLTGHVNLNSRSGYASQYISTTRDFENVAKHYADATGYRVVRINLDLLPDNVKIYDLSIAANRQSLLNGERAMRYAGKSAEVDILGFIPPEAIELFYKP